MDSWFQSFDTYIVAGTVTEAEDLTIIYRNKDEKECPKVTLIQLCGQA